MEQGTGTDRAAGKAPRPRVHGVRVDGVDAHGRVPAIVLGRGTTALGMLRSLRMAGIPAYVACPADDQATRSRWYRPTPGRPWDGSLGAAGLEALRDLPLRRAVLIPGADDAASWLSELPRSPLAERFKASTSSRTTQDVLQDKARFAAFVAAAGTPHPRTYAIDSLDDIEAIPFAELDKVFVKPVNSQRFSAATGVKGFWAGDHAELRDHWHKLQPLGVRLMAQEYVPGPASAHYFVDGFRDADGRFTALFARQRIRMWPADFGNSSYCRSIPLSQADAPVDAITRLLSKLDYRGIFSAEFKFDARDGRHKIIEVNGRAWAYVEFAARCGINVCEMAYRDALGMPVVRAPRDYRSGAGCLNLQLDLSAVRRDPAARAIHRLPGLLLQWARAHFHAFRPEDPMPGLVAARRMLAPSRSSP